MSEFDDLKKKIELTKNKNKINLSKNNNNILGLAFRISTELVAAVFVATFIGKRIAIGFGKLLNFGGKCRQMQNAENGGKL